MGSDDDAMAARRTARTIAGGADGARLRRRAHSRRLPDPVPRGPRQAARLSRQRRLGAEAALGARGDGSRLSLRIRQRASRPALSLQHRDASTTRLRARPCAAFSMPAARTRSSSRATPPSAINLVARSFGADEIGEGDEIVLSIMEHHANIVPWHFLRERKGAVLKWAPMTDSGELPDRQVRALLITKRTKMVAITHMSNVLGTVNPVKEIIRIAHASGVPVLDRRQPGGRAHGRRRARSRLPISTSSPATRPTARPASACCTPRRQHLDAMPPYEGGGDMIENVAVDRITYNKPPHKFEAGTPPIVEAIGLGAALNYMMQIGRDKIAALRGASFATMRTRTLGGAAMAEDLRHRSGQGRDLLVHGRRPAPARRLDHHRPVGRRHPRRPPLRAAADGAPRRDGDVPRLVRDVQYQGRGRCARRRADQGARAVCVRRIGAWTAN